MDWLLILLFLLLLIVRDFLCGCLYSLASLYNFVEETYISENVDGNNNKGNQNVFRSRKRISRPNSHKKVMAKELVERGTEHKTAKGVRKAKVLKIQTICKCTKRNCPSKIDVLRQQEIFDAFYKIADWSQKTLYIRQSVKTSKVAKKRKQMFPIIALKNRTTNFAYSLLNSDGISVKVCRDFFF